VQPAIAIGTLWLATRLGMLFILLVPGRSILNDTAYYFTSMSQPNATALAEYPTPILWIMRLFFFISGGHEVAFLGMVSGMTVVLDLLVTVTLYRMATPLTAGYWVVFLFLLGPIMWLRIDLIPAACVTLAMLTQVGRPRLSGLMLALGAATKFWPALLVIPAAGHSVNARKYLPAFLTAGGLLGGISLVVDGWARSISPVLWQSQRGLQVESLAATWAMIRHATSPGYDIVFMSHYKAWEVMGRGVAKGEFLSTLFTVATVVLALVLAYLLVVRPRLSHAETPADPADGLYAILLAQGALIVAMIAVNKVLSPQYIIWLAGPLAILWGKARETVHRRPATIVAVLGCAVAAVTQVLFPFNYDALLTNPTGSLGATAILVVRNLLIGVMTVFVVVWALRLTWRLAGPPECRSLRCLARWLIGWDRPDGIAEPPDEGQVCDHATNRTDDQG